MKIACLILLGCACALAMELPMFHQKFKTVDKQWLDWQKSIITLFKYSPQTSYYKEHLEIAKTFSIENHYESYTDQAVVKNFLSFYKHGMLPKGAIFSIFYKDHLKEAIALFKLFYYAKDFDTFYKTAVWARNNVNEGMFVYAFSVAVIHRDDTFGMVLPPIYEVWPHYFFSPEYINKAQEFKQLYVGGSKYNGLTIDTNYTGWYLNVHPEQSMSYFTEDVGINAYYYYYNLYYPFWFGGEGFNTKYWNRGEQYYYFYQQLVARYYLERLSNDFGEIPMYDYQQPFKVGYYPSLTYHNGLAFPQRPNYAMFMKNYYNYGQSVFNKGLTPYSYTFVVDYERRIRDAIDSGYVITDDGKKINLFEPEGFQMLGNLIEGNPDSPNTKFYGTLQIYARHLLGYSQQPLHKYQLAPSALEHFETSLRDPAFWMLFKRMTMYFQKFKSHLPTYNYSDLSFPGVKIMGVSFSRLITYFDYFNVDISNAVSMNPSEFESDSFTVTARQQRLNHKPFTYKINVESDKVAKSVVRVFLGPKYDEYGRPIVITENRLNFVEVDKFTYDLKVGQNEIVRNSHDLLFSNDFTTYKQMYQYIMGANSGDHEFKWMNGTQAYYGFPRRFLLPMGKYGGQTYQFYVMVSQYKPYSGHDKTADYWYPMFGAWTYYVDSYPLGYPFDKFIDTKTFFVPNAYFHDVMIYHKNYDEVNTSL